MSTTPQGQAETFRALHAKGELLLLANAWDAGSARVIETCGSLAIATTSAGLAWSRGYADGGALPPRVLEAAVGEIVRTVRVPVTVDIEQGYSADPAAAAETVTALIHAGAVGINIEDGADAPNVLCSKIEAARMAAARAGVALFVNARTDVYLRGLASDNEAVDEVLARIERYRAAGCDGLFVPMLAETAIRAVVRAVEPLPFNLMAVPGLPPAVTLAGLGVRRLSAGAAIAQAALGLSHQLAAQFLGSGRADDLFPPTAAGYAATNALFATQN
jgi:2-methylisocitrate lyase-like PEP mutase family enzyme